MKRLTTSILALLMICCTSISAFASSYTPYSPDRIIKIATDTDGNNVLSYVKASYLSSNDEVEKLISKSSNADDFVETIGLEDKVENMISDFTVSNQRFIFSSSNQKANASPSNPIDVKFKVTGVKPNDTVVLLLKTSDSWNVLPAKASLDAVEARFTSWGKVVVLIGKAAKNIVFDDVNPSDWYYESVMYCAKKGIVAGIGNNKYGPYMNTTRAMVAQMIYNLEDSPAISGDDPFLDTPASWYEKAIAWCYKNGIVVGYSATEFGPNDLVTREQLANIIYRYEKYLGKEFKGDWMFQIPCDDAGSVSSWATEGVYWAYMNKVMTGRYDATTGKTLLVPKASSTRAELAQVFYNYMK